MSTIVSLLTPYVLGADLNCSESAAKKFGQANGGKGSVCNAETRSCGRPVRAVDGQITAPMILSELLVHLRQIWPSRLMLGGVPLGDCWRHPSLEIADATSELMPLHKLSQWLAYSLVEPLEASGLNVVDIDGLSGLAEYRNGGLLIDTGVLMLCDPENAARVSRPRLACRRCPGRSKSYPCWPAGNNSLTRSSRLSFSCFIEP